MNGKIKDAMEDRVILNVNGVGYEAFCIERECVKFAGKIGDDAELFTFYYLRDNTAELYGFTTLAEKEMFQILIGVSGVGPKGALNVLNAAPLELLQRGIAEGDTSVLTRVSGIGNKIAQKIILELKDKFGEEWAGLGGDIRVESDVVEALESLGYSKAQAQSVLKELPPDVKETEDKVKAALKLLSN
ncbi:MAG: Holliday junction branch migration protein RuvA [Candidatus Spechtbacterales bacterium]|nr:Holliday junction branch migration protein RuvA [Candidatus Spechtbacterales bacterium]